MKDASPLLAPRDTRLPAWLLSVGFHACLVLSLALFVHSAVPRPLAEADRPVEIVLATRGEGDQAQYYSEEDVSPSETEAEEHTPENLDAALPQLDHARTLVDRNEVLPKSVDHLVRADLVGRGLLGAADSAVAGQPRGIAVTDDPSILAGDPVRNRPPGPTGPPARVSVFGVAAQGRSFVFLIDRSQSMGAEGHGALPAAERELVAALAELSPVHRFQILAYNQKLHYFAERRPVTATVENQQKAAKFLASLVASGGTEHEMGVLAAVRQQPDVIFILSDADHPPLSAAQLRQITVGTAGKITIHAIQFGSGPLKDDNPFLARLARLNGGVYRYVDVLQLAK